MPSIGVPVLCIASLSESTTVQVGSVFQLVLNDLKREGETQLVESMLEASFCSILILA